MTRKEYLEEVKEAVIGAIKENYQAGDLVKFDELYDKLWIDDSVTGNASGSYYCNSYKAREALGNDIEELVEDIEADFGPIPNDKRYDWEYIDVSVRCLVLGEAIREAFDDLQDEEIYQFIY